MALIGNQCPLVFEKCIRFRAAGTTQRQSHSSRVNASARRLSAGILTFGFLSHEAPKARPVWY
jgi:hypothetical protein